MNIKVIKNITDMQKIRKQLSGSVGFVPTMGYLHEGHMSLVKLAQKENDHVLVSIFVNPKQFGPHDDFQKYPRDTERDLQLLERAKTDIVFLPEVNALYPPGFETSVSLAEITQKLEGKIRPGHFTGVATVLVKLFNITAPTKAYFGQKDAQQVIVVKKLVKDLTLPVEIVVGDTIREADGLAMSSRNVFLNSEERKKAATLYQSLGMAKKMFAQGERDPQKIKNAMEEMLLATEGAIDYISIADSQSLEEITSAASGALVSLAVRFGKTRLIDNIIL